MCGISGILKYQPHHDRSIMEDLTLMNEKLHHRGPDDNGLWVNEIKSVGLAHTRLSILDLSSLGHQPMVDQDYLN
jgi:asparagine synthase (glutamine-hydrolysing)